MTTAEHIRSIASSNTAEVAIAGVPWPRYKIVALIAGLVVALVVGIITMNPAPAVLAGAAVAALVWLAFGSIRRFGS
jgi:tetrahydromethanopterin S-methyltransferase subunit E